MKTKSETDLSGVGRIMAHNDDIRRAKAAKGEALPPIPQDASFVEDEAYNNMSERDGHTPEELIGERGGS